MVGPLVLVHGGAGDIPESRVKPKLDGVCNAVKSGYEILLNGGSAIDAVQVAVQRMEDDPAFNAGHGSVLNINGDVEMDALIMEGTDLKAGAVAAITNVSHPIDVARLVMEKSPHVLLVGDGAKRFATDQGVSDVAVNTLVTKDSVQSLKDFCNQGDVTRTETGYSGEFGTVGAVAIDSEGRVASATSTGGTSGKMIGRVGDTPLPGSGGYADNCVGAVSTTGHGESIMKFCLSHSILNLMKQGKSAQKATEESCKSMTERLGNTAGAITLAKDGNIGIYFTSKRMAWAYISQNKICYGIEQGQLIEEILKNV